MSLSNHFAKFTKETDGNCSKSVNMVTRYL